MENLDPRQRVCRICCRATAKYTCASCNAPYCSVACYQSHGVACTERFYEAQVTDALRARGVDDAVKRRTLAAVRRVEAQRRDDARAGCDARALAALGCGARDADADADADDAVSSYGGDDDCAGIGDGGDGGDGGDASGATVARLHALSLSAAAGALTLEDLTPAERASFLRAAADGSLTPAVVPAHWAPWWLRRGSGLGHSGRRLIEVVATVAASTAPAAATTRDDATAPSVARAPTASTPDTLAVGLSPRRRTPAAGGDSDYAARTGMAAAASVDTSDVLQPPPRHAPPPPLASLLRGAPSPLLRCNVCDVLYAYAHVTRLYCGDWDSDDAGAAAAVVALSGVLAADARHASVAAACAAAMEASLAPAVALVAQPGRAGGRSACRVVLDDVRALLARPEDVVQALLDARAVVAAAAATALRAAPVVAAARPTALDAAARKLLFFAAWAADAVPALAASRADVAAFARRLAEGGGWAAGDAAGGLPQAADGDSGGVAAALRSLGTGAPSTRATTA